MTLVTLGGTPERIGRALGELWAADLAQDTDAFFARMEHEGIDAGAMLKAGGEYARRMHDVAPHMLAETRAMAEAAGVAPERFAAYAGLKYCYPERVYRWDRWQEPHHSCTSFLAVGTASGVAANLVHKNRDARQVPQAAHIKHVAGKRRVLGAGDVGDVGLCHALNADGLAGKTNTGDAVEIPLRHAISTTEVLRLVVEECATCEQALDLMKGLAGAGLISNGTCGCIWLFADRERGLIVEEVPFRLEWRFIEDDVDARGNDFRLPGLRVEAPDAPRYVVATREMRALRGRARPEDLSRLSRSVENHPTSICHDATNSASTSVVPHDPDAAPYWEYACGHPNNTFYLPVSPAARGVPRCLVDGSLWRVAHALHEGNRLGPHPGLDLKTHEARFRERHRAACGSEALTSALEQNTCEALDALRQAAEAAGVPNHERALGE